MKRLILLRHAKTEQTAAGGGDFDRALTERGLRDAATVGHLLAEAGIAPDLVLVSTAKRAMQTWEAAEASFPNARLAPTSALYHASPETIAGVVEQIGDGPDTVMIIGHNPGLHEYALDLLAQHEALVPAPLSDGFPTAAAVVFARDTSGDFDFERYLSPREHAG